jgi:hypothetical protein
VAQSWDEGSESDPSTLGGYAAEARSFANERTERMRTRRRTVNDGAVDLLPVDGADILMERLGVPGTREEVGEFLAELGRCHDKWHQLRHGYVWLETEYPEGTEAHRIATRLREGMSMVDVRAIFGRHNTMVAIKAKPGNHRSANNIKSWPMYHWRDDDWTAWEQLIEDQTKIYHAPTLAEQVLGKRDSWAAKRNVIPLLGVYGRRLQVGHGGQLPSEKQAVVEEIMWANPAQTKYQLSKAVTEHGFPMGHETAAHQLRTFWQRYAEMVERL